MAEAKLNFDENILDKQSGLYDLYSRLYDGMRIANNVDAPSFNTPPTTEEGEIDTAAINKSLQDYSTILMKNSAYLFATSIVTVIAGDGNGTSGVGLLSRNGDSMIGQLSALYGFQAGYNGNKILEAIIDSKDKSWIDITGNMSVSENIVVDGELHLSDNGIYFNDNQMIYYSDTTLHIDSQDIALNGEIDVDGSINLGDVRIDKSGIYYGDNEFYHSGNSNRADVDWTMCNAFVAGNLDVDGVSVFNDTIYSNGGFQLSSFDRKLFYSDNTETTLEDGTVVNTPFLVMSSDLKIVNGYGIKFDDTYIVKVRSGSENIVSFSAPGMTMNLGDSDGETATDHIALQSSIWNYSSDYKIISQYGDGNFPNSFSAGCGNSGSTVLRTFYTDKDHCGIIALEEVRFGDQCGPSLFGNGNILSGTIPYLHIVDDVQQTDDIGFSISSTMTTSPFRDLSKSFSATLLFDSDAEFIAFNKPTEAESFSIKSELYKTRLIENTLFFDDGKFLEGVVDGIRHAGNAYFDENLSSPRFASGFAGYGWSVRVDEMVGGYGATFDELTVRKKMRVYELEVQKISVTNGSLWVSDSCSGDEVRAL